jgi:integrase
MAHVEDQWKYPDGTCRSRDGTGKRWRVRYVDPAGHERSRSFDRKTDADKFEKTTAADLLRGQYADPKSAKITLREYAAGWLANQTWGESTRETNERRLQLHILPVLGPRLLAQMTPSVLQSWLKGLDLAPTYVCTTLTLLSSVLNAAVDDGLIAKNPVQARSVRAPKVDQTQIVPWTAERVSAIRASLPAQCAAMADCGSGLGLRQGEVLGLAAEDVDWLRRTVRVRRQVKIVRGKLVFGLPKGGKERNVPLPDSVSFRLAEHIRQQPSVTVTLPWQAPGGKPVTADLLFTSAGNAINRNRWNANAWNPALKKAGVPGGRDAGFHQLRHHFASSLLSQGVDVRALATYLGHGDPGFTLKVYTHLMPDVADRMRQAIDAALSHDGTATSQTGGNRL